MKLDKDFIKIYLDRDKEAIPLMREIERLERLFCKQKKYIPFIENYYNLYELRYLLKKEIDNEN